jgi:hypothetical protein
MSTYDVVIFDDASSPFSPRLAESKGLGGVEWTLMLLAQALAEDGLSVLVLNKLDGRWTHQPICQAGWLEYGHYSRAYSEKISCEALVVSRWSAVPPVAHKRVVFSMHDIPASWMFARTRKWLDEGAPAVCVSTWLAGKIGELGRDWRCPVIAPMLRDECYERGPKNPNVFVYASAAVKGLPETIDTWECIREHFPETHLTELYVATNGYDKPSDTDALRMYELAIRPLWQLPARAIIAALRNAAGLFFVNSYPETHGIICSTALALGCRTHVLTLDDPAALPETLAGAPLLTRDKHAFVEDFVRAYRDSAQDTYVMPAEMVPDRRADALLPAWKEVLFDAA